MDLCKYSAFDFSFLKQIGNNKKLQQQTNSTGDKRMYSAGGASNTAWFRPG